MVERKTTKKPSAADGLASLEDETIFEISGSMPELFDFKLFEAFQAAREGKASSIQLEALDLWRWLLVSQETKQAEYVSFDELVHRQEWDNVVNAPWLLRDAHQPTVRDEPIRQKKLRDHRQEEERAKLGRIQAIHGLRERRESAVYGDSDLWEELIYVSRYLILMSLPYRPTKEREIVRYARLGDGRTVEMTIGSAFASVPLSYGADRSLIHWLLDRGIRQVRQLKKENPGWSNEDMKAAHWVAWPSAADYLRDMGLDPNSGKNLKDLKDRWRRVKGLRIGLRIQGDDTEILEEIKIVDQLRLPSEQDFRRESGGEHMLLNNYFGAELSTTIIEAMMERPVPVPRDFLINSRSSSQIQDYQLFLMYRSYAARSETLIPWEDLAKQLWSEDSNFNRLKARFAQAIKELKLIWPELNARALKKGLAIGEPKGKRQFLPKGSALRKTLDNKQPHLQV